MMKMTLKSLTVLALSGILMTYAGCSHHHDTPVPVTDTQIDALSKSVWKATAVTRDSDDKTSDYTATPFTLTFSGTHGQTTIGFTAAGRPALSAWPATGSFTFSTTAPTTTMTRTDPGADPVTFTYSVSSSQLILRFQYNGVGFAGRTAEVTGNWQFTMVPK